MIKLFTNLRISEMFHFYDTPNRVLIKSDDSHYVGPEGLIRPMHPYVAIVPDQPKAAPSWLGDDLKGEDDERQPEG